MAFADEDRFPGALTPDERIIRDSVGGETFRRGRAYAETGRVLQVQRGPNARAVLGQVAGSGHEVYDATAVLTRDGADRLIAFRGTCTCPMRTLCKHTVAVALVALSGDVTAAEAPPAPVPVAAPAAPPPWEVALRRLIDGPDRAGDEVTVGLQFELVAAERSFRTGLASPTRLAVRPVVPGQAARSDRRGSRRGGSGHAWVRTGISWGSLPYGPMRWAHPERIDLLRELAALDTMGHASYGYSSQPIYVDTIRSPRLWTLLSDAVAAGIPLVRSDRVGTPVSLVPEAVTASVEVQRDRGDLALAAYLDDDGHRLDPDHLLLLGDPAHGVAWWDRPIGPGGPLGDRLRLARLAAPADPVVRDLLGRRVIVPARDADRFFTGYYPALANRTTLVAAPGLELPERAPAELVLTVTPVGPRLSLHWQWRYAVGEAARLEPLRAASAIGRDLEREQQVLDAVTATLAGYDTLWTDTAIGRLLLPNGWLSGFPTVQFTSEALPALRAEPGVRVVVDGDLATYRQADAAPVVTVTDTTAAGITDWFDLSVTVTVDGEDVPFEALFVALASGQDHLVLPSGTWFALDTPELAALAEVIAESRAMNDGDGEPDSIRLTRFQASLWDALDRVAVTNGQAAQWQASVRRLADVDALTPPPVPLGLDATLRHYQADGFAWLGLLHDLGLGGVLADEMGLGKTVQTIALIQHVLAGGAAPGPFLVVAPTSVVYTWFSECRRFAPGLDVRLVTGTTARRGATLAAVADGADIVVTSYALFRLEYDGYAELPWAGLILDEAQFVKNSSSKAWQCAKKLPAPFKLAITGTPMENNLGELWALLSITAPGLFPSLARFEEHYRWPIERENATEKMAQLRERVRPLMLRRTKSQVLSELPPKQEQVLELPLNPKHRKVYDTLLARERQKVLGLLGDLEKNRFAIFRSLTLLRQAALSPALVDGQSADVPATKLDALMELIEELVSEGHRAVVFSQFTRFLGAARTRLDAEKIRYSYLDGATLNRPAVVEEFRSGDAAVFLISLKAGGFGLTLTEADYAILLDPWWNPATENQAVDRIHRIGQTRSVMVYRLVAKDTIEEKVMALKARKAALFGSLMDAGADDAPARGLTAADIRSLLS